MDPLNGHPAQASGRAYKANERMDDRASPLGAGSDRIPRQPGRTRLPLSYSQQRLWFMGQLQPGSIDYNRSFGLRVSGPLDFKSLQHALNEIVRRHTVLRTSFPVIDGSPVQKVNPPRPVDLPLHDLSGLPDSERRSEATRLGRQMAGRPFDLIHDPLLRAEIMRVDPEQHIFIVTTHHIVFDGFSESIFLRELSALYAAARAGREPLLAEPVIQYGDYAAWERERARGKALDAHLRYWRESLSELSPRPGLPTLERESPNLDEAAGRESLELSDHLSAALRSVGRQEGVTPFMIFASAFLLLIHRLSDSDDIVVGFPVAGRNRLEVEDLIGMFINTLPLRVTLSGDPTFSELLRRVRRATVGGLAHQELPFERLVEEIQPERSLARPPLFDFMINSHVFHHSEVGFGDLVVEDFPLPELAAPYPLTFYVCPEDEGFRLEMSYQTAKFSGEQVRRLLRQLAFMLDQAVADLEKPIGKLSLLDPGSIAFLPDPASPLPEPEYPTVVSMVAEWVSREPTSVAVSERVKSYSYGELWEASAGVAESLTEAGLQPGHVVAIVGRRSFELVAGMLGVMMGGGVILLIDQDWPRAQIETMLDRGQARRVLMTGNVTPDHLWMRQTAGLIVHDSPDAGDRSRGLESGRAIAAGLVSPAPSDPAYVFFTSGTAGRPDAVLGWHKGLSHFLAWQRITFGVGPGDRCGLLTGLSFDPILRDVFLPLTSGGKVCVPDPDLSSASERILPWIDRERITILHSVPSLVRAWMSGRPSRASLETLRWIFLSGEPLGVDIVRSFRQTFPLAGKLVNLYGPTETTFVKSWFTVPERPTPGIQPIGSPLPQTQVLVLNPKGQLCGIGEPGEIVIRTPYRTLGYLTPDTARRSNFQPNPHTDDPNDLLYWTGDRGYYRSDGTVGYLGRIDHQVKIHGTRVEPDGVTAILSQLPGVLDCIVIPVDDEHGAHRLIAYTVVKDPSVNAEGLREGLAQMLPAAMVPTGFVFLESLPLTPNGKVDREALQARPALGVTKRAEVVPPRTPLERRLVRIWEHVLNSRPIGIRDDFFDKGGHSLLAVRMFVEVEKATRKRLPVRVIFEAPTIERLAALIRSEDWTPPDTQLVPIQPGGTKRPIFWVHAAGGHVLSYTRLARYLGPDQPVYALQGVNLEEDRATEASVEDMAARYITDLRKVEPSGPYFVGGLSFGGIVAWEIAQQLSTQGLSVALLILLDTRGPGYPRRPLFQRLVLEMRQRLEFHRGNLSVLEPGRKLKYFIERARMSFSPRAVRKAYRGDIRARSRYVAKPYPGQIAFFRAQAQPDTHEYPQMGWEGLALGGMEIYDVPGAHVSIMAEPHLQVLAANLKECLERAQVGPFGRPSEKPT